VFPTDWVEAAFAPWLRASDWRPGAQFCVSVDLGQMSDPTAIAVMEGWTEPSGEMDRATFAQGRQKRFAVRWLERVPLGTSYVDVVELVFRLVRQWKQLGNCVVVVDATGVGAAVLDMLRKRGFGECRVVPVVFTGAERETYNIDRWHVPKRDLVQGLAVLLEMGGLQVEPLLAEAGALRRELSNVRWGVSAGGADLFGGGRRHDDLVMALALGVWWGRRWS
jgi:hypothetical protein